MSPGQRRVMLVGAARSGRNRLMQSLCPVGLPLAQHIMATTYLGPFVLPPAEFLENRRFYNKLVTLGASCGTLLFLQSATARTSVFPPGFARLFNRKVIGIVTCNGELGADPCRARRFLEYAGALDVRILADDEGSSAIVSLREELFSRFDKAPKNQ